MDGTGKQCTKCNEVKPLTEFTRQTDRPDGLRTWCRTCSSVYRKLYYRANTERELLRKQVWRAAGNGGYDSGKRSLYLYGLDTEQIQEILLEQGGCAICGTMDPGGRWNAWHIDHDHECCETYAKGGKSHYCGNCTRGILCQNCNLLIGFASEDPAILALASTYLEKWKKKLLGK